MWSSIQTRGIHVIRSNLIHPQKIHPIYPSNKKFVNDLIWIHPLKTMDGLSSSTLFLKIQ